MPFCARLCPYCAFPVAVGQDGLQEAYVQALLVEARSRAPELRSPAASLNLGGGTPSRLGPRGLEDLVLGLRSLLPFEKEAEFSLEANPEDVTPDKARVWKGLGVTRVSLGAQSLDAADLGLLGRVHTAEGVGKAMEILRAEGITNLNLDIIAGASLAGGAWRASLRGALGLSPDHVSFYILEYEAGTFFSRRASKDRWDEDREAGAILEARDLLGEAGYEWYELSNFARPGRRCRHNDLFWKGGDVLGLGPGAASALGLLRRKNPGNLRVYIEDPLKPLEEESLDPWSLAAEALIRGLRTREGVDLSSFEHGPGILAAAAGIEVRGLIEVRGSRLVSTDQGRLLADGLARDLMPTERRAYIHGDDRHAA